MIRILDGLPDEVLGVEATGKVTEDDYEEVLAPAVRDKHARHDSIRIVYLLGDEFDGWTTGAMWQDVRLGIFELRAWKKVAVVSDKDWVQRTVAAIGWMMPGEMRVFKLDDLAKAKEWAAS